MTNVIGVIKTDGVNIDGFKRVPLMIMVNIKQNDLNEKHEFIIYLIFPSTTSRKPDLITKFGAKI